MWQVSGAGGSDGNDAGGVAGAADYERAIGERDARIAELEAWVAEAAKSAQTADELRARIVELKAQGESDRIDFSLRLAGVRNVKAARAVLDECEGNVEALRAGEPWLFTQAGATSQLTSHEFGATGMEPAGVAGGSDERDLRRWERIAGMADEEAWQMANSVAYRKNYTDILERMYQKAACSTVLNSPARMARAGRNAKEIMIPKISVTGLGDYTRNVGYKTGSIDFSYETKAFGHDRGIKLLADVMNVEEAGIMDCFVEAGAELQRAQVAPEADACTFSRIASHEGVTVTDADLFKAKAADVLSALREVTSAMDEAQVSTGSRYLFITPMLKGVLDDYSLANPNMSNRVNTRFARIVEVPQARFYTKIDLLSGDSDQVGYAKASDGRDINFMVVEKSAVIKFDKHVASRVFSSDELESLDSYMMKYCKYSIVELLDDRLAVQVSSICQSPRSTEPSMTGSMQPHSQKRRLR